MIDDDFTTEYAIRHPDGTILDPTHHRRSAEERLARYREKWPDAQLVTRLVAHGDWAADGVKPEPPVMLPRRSDQFEQWLKTQRDEFERRDSVWPILDYLLDQYRLHADTRTPLDRHVCENGNPDDCHGCCTQQHPPIRSCNLDHVHDAHNWDDNGTEYGCIGFPTRKETDR